VPSTNELPIQGCGRGYDVIALSLHGFDAYGLEISATAISEAQALAQTELASPSAENFGARRTTSTTALHGHGNDAEDLSLSPGTPRFLQGDFFDSSWSDALGVQFDVVYDYTVSTYTWLQKPSAAVSRADLGCPVDGVMLLTRGIFSFCAHCIRVCGDAGRSG
jgi:hypothetical protein